MIMQLQQFWCFAAAAGSLHEKNTSGTHHVGPKYKQEANGSTLGADVQVDNPGIITNPQTDNKPEC